MRNRAPRFSVVLPTHDRPRWLKAAVESVLEQTYDDFDVWIVDDGSRAPTVKVCDGLGRTPRIHVLRNPHPAGAAAARNRGVRAARGEYVAFIDDDCSWHPGRLEAIDRVIRSESPRPDYICTQAVRLKRGPPACFVVDPVLDPDDAPWRVSTPMIVARRELFIELGGFDSRLPRAHDWDLAIRLVDAGEWTLIDHPLVWAEDLPGLTSDPAKIREASRVMLRKYGRRSPVSRTRTLELHRAFAHKLLTLGHAPEGRRHYRRAAGLAPFFLRNWLTLALSVGGSGLYRFVTGMVERMRERKDR